MAKNFTYRTIRTNIWNDPWFKSLTPQAKILFIYLWTNLHCNQAGCYEIDIDTMSSEIRFSAERFLKEITCPDEKTGRCRVAWYDRHNVVWIKNFLEYQCQNDSFKLAACRCLLDLNYKVALDFIKYNKLDSFIDKKIPKFHESFKEEDSVDTVLPESPVSGITEQNRTEQNRTETENTLSGAPTVGPPIDDKPPIKEIVEYLNQVTGRAFTSTVAKTRSLIKARWREGHRFDEFKKAIDVKSKQWLSDPHMSQFLRPETLFGNKFEGYLQEALVTPNPLSKNTSGIREWMERNMDDVPDIVG